MITEKTYVKVTLAMLIIVLIFIITSTVTATTWKVTIEKDVQSNGDDIIRIDKAQHLDAQIRTKQTELITEMSTDIKWIINKLEQE